MSLSRPDIDELGDENDISAALICQLNTLRNIYWSNKHPWPTSETYFSSGARTKWRCYSSFVNCLFLLSGSSLLCCSEFKKFYKLFKYIDIKYKLWLSVCSFLSLTHTSQPLWKITYVVTGYARICLEISFHFTFHQLLTVFLYTFLNANDKNIVFEDTLDCGLSGTTQ